MRPIHFLCAIRLILTCLGLAFLSGCHGVSDTVAGRKKTVTVGEILPESLHHKAGLGYAVAGSRKSTLEVTTPNGRQPDIVLMQPTFLLVPEEDVRPQLERLDRLGEAALEPGRCREEMAVLNQVSLHGYEATQGNVVPYPEVENLPEGYLLVVTVTEGTAGRLRKPVSRTSKTEFEHPGLLILTVPLDVACTLAGGALLMLGSFAGGL